jgi:hypothetical protein
MAKMTVALIALIGLGLLFPGTVLAQEPTGNPYNVWPDTSVLTVGEVEEAAGLADVWEWGVWSYREYHEETWEGASVIFSWFLFAQVLSESAMFFNEQDATDRMADFKTVFQEYADEEGYTFGWQSAPNYGDESYSFWLDSVDGDQYYEYVFFRRANLISITGVANVQLAPMAEASYVKQSRLINRQYSGAKLQKHITFRAFQPSDQEPIAFMSLLLE